MLIISLTGCQTFFDKKNLSKSETRHESVGLISSHQKFKTKKTISQPVAEMISHDVAQTHEITITERHIRVPAYLEGRLLLGIKEQATLPNFNLTMEAKLDTGSTDSSIDAREIQFFERDGKKWVKFNLHRVSNGVTAMELPIKCLTRIKRPGLPSIERPVVVLTLTIGDITQSVPVTLTDRSKFETPLLVGRSFMQDLAIIDVSQQYIGIKSLVSSKSVKCRAPLSKQSYAKDTIESVSSGNLPIIGAIEEVTLTDLEAVFEARIDTGAETSSIDARDIELFSKDGQDWVHFQLPTSSGEFIPMQEPVTRFLMITVHGEEDQQRPVVTLNTRIGDSLVPIQFSLRSRENNKYPVLIGAQFLNKRALVDVSKEYVTGKNH